MIDRINDLIEEYLLAFILLAPFVTQLGIPLGLTFFLMLQGSLIESYLYFINLCLSITVMLFLADLIAYWIGYKYGPFIFNSKFTQQEKVKKGIVYIQKTTKERFLFLIFASRTFLLGIAFLTNYLFGAEKMPLKKIILPLFLAELLYSTLFISIGFFFKETWEYLFTLISESIDILLLGIILYFIIKSLKVKRKHHHTNNN